jgi:ribose transport system substrate-binding protein
MTRTLALTASAVLAVGLAACGSDDDGGSAETTAAASATTAGGAATTAAGAGAETTAAGEGFTIGFTNPLGSNDQLAVLQRAIEARAKCLGGTVVSLDSNLDVDKQISDIDQLVSQGVDGIIVFPLDAQAVLPAVERAKSAGIKTVGVNVSLEDPTVADVAPFDASVNQGTEQMATETAKFVIDELGGKGNVLGVGIGFPVPVIDYQMKVMQEAATAGGLTWLDKVDNPTDDSAGAQPVVEQALLRFPDMQAIMAYNEPSALGAYAAVNAAGKTNDILITGANGTESGVQAVEAGEIAATWDLLPWKQGVTFVNVLKALIDGQTAETTTVVPVQMLTKDNLSEQVNWDQAVTDIGACKVEE